MTPLEVMRSKFPDLDKWRLRSASETRPLAGSQLADDDADFPRAPLSQLAKAGLCSAWDHLDAIRVLVEAPKLMPFAQPTLARGAIVGASLAVWLLAPDERSERLKRARCLQAHNYDRHRQYLALVDAPSAVRDLVDARLDEVERQRAAAGERSKFTDTGMIEKAAEATFLPDHPDAHGQVLQLWRQTSGIAHGLVWAHLGRPGSTWSSDVDENGVSATTSGGDETELANFWMCGYRLSVKGWQLLDQRSGL